MILFKDSTSLLVRITTWVYHVDYMEKGAGCLTADIYFMLFLLSFDSRSASSHYIPQNFIHLGFKATHKLHSGEVSLCSVPTKIKVNKGHIPHPSGVMGFIMASCLRELQ